MSPRLFEMLNGFFTGTDNQSLRIHKPNILPSLFQWNLALHSPNVLEKKSSLMHTSFYSLPSLISQEQLVQLFLCQPASQRKWSRKIIWQNGFHWKKSPSLTSPAPRKRNLWLAKDPPTNLSAPMSPASTTDAVPCIWNYSFRTWYMCVSHLNQNIPEYRHWKQDVLYHT